MDDGMAEYIGEALYALKKSIDKQNSLQEETNDLLRAMNQSLKNTGQATADLAEVITKRV